MDLYRIEVGKENGVDVRNIVGAIANEGNISSRYIGNIKLYEKYSTVELPKDMPNDLLRHFETVRVMNIPMNMRLVDNSRDNKKAGRRPTSRRDDNMFDDMPKRRTKSNAKNSEKDNL